jgi:DNA adenine methylase
MNQRSQLNGSQSMQRSLFDATEDQGRHVLPFKQQLLKWIGSKQRFAHEIAFFFPPMMDRYFEPFLGSGAVLGTLAPTTAIASDVFKPLMEIWQALQADPTRLKAWYAERRRAIMAGDKVVEYEKIKTSYNANPNGADLLVLCRACYGGVVRFRKADGYMSTPCGAHIPIPLDAFSRRVDEWRRRTAGTQFRLLDYREAMELARKGDLVYCDPPYKDAQTILYGAQAFSLRQLFEVISRCKRRGVYVALSIDGTKRSGDRICDVSIPDGLFEREVFVNCGRSMLRRFQMGGQTLEGEVVADRLLLTY